MYTWTGHCIPTGYYCLSQILFQPRDSIVSILTKIVSTLDQKSKNAQYFAVFQSFQGQTNTLKSLFYFVIFTPKNNIFFKCRVFVFILKPEVVCLSNRHYVKWVVIFKFLLTRRRMCSDKYLSLSF